MDESGEQFVAYFLSTESTLEKKDMSLYAVLNTLTHYLSFRLTPMQWIMFATTYFTAIKNVYHYQQTCPNSVPK